MDPDTEEWMYPRSFKGYAATDDELVPLLRDNLNFHYRGDSEELAIDLHGALTELNGPVIICRAKINESFGYVYTYDRHMRPQPRIPTKMVQKMSQIFGAKPRVFVRCDDPETPDVYNVTSLEGCSVDSVTILAEDP